VQQTLKDFDVIEKELDGISRPGDRGRGGVWEKTPAQSFEDYPKLYDVVAQRNRKWLPRNRNFLRDNDNYLVVVGVGHLTGKDSLVGMLRQKGYKVEQL